MTVGWRDGCLTAPASIATWIDIHEDPAAPRGESGSRVSTGWSWKGTKSSPSNPGG